MSVCDTEKWRMQTLLSPMLFGKWGHKNSFVRLSVTKTLTWLISSVVLMIEHWYLACIILVTFNPFDGHHAVTFTFDLFSDAENSRSACFDWHKFIRTNINYEILLHILLFGLALFFKFLNLTCLFKKFSASLPFLRTNFLLRGAPQFSEFVC